MFGCVFDYIDRHFGEKAVVVVTADHGLLMPYLEKEKKNDTPFLTDVRVNIPLYMRGGGVRQMDYEPLCSPNIDIPVMLLQLAGIKPDADDFDGVNFLDPLENREYVISEYAYYQVYEIAVRGGGYALFLKYALDETCFKLTSKEPLYEGLYRLHEERYLAGDNLIERESAVAGKLKKIATEHFIKKGILEGISSHEKKVLLHGRAGIV
jgi:arylsulfatase A-like enzyme